MWGDRKWKTNHRVIQYRSLLIVLALTYQGSPKLLAKAIVTLVSPCYHLFLASSLSRVTVYPETFHIVIRQNKQ